MMTVFERIPDYFVERYDDELCAWATNFKKIGPRKSIMLREGSFSTVSPDEEQGAELLVVTLLARMAPRHGKVTVEPFDEKSEMLIRRHCEKMQRLGVPARAILKEPPRPWLPFMPTIGRG